MELVLTNGWNSNHWMFDNLNRFRRAIDETAGYHTMPRADIVEDKDAYHFYVEMPGVKNESIDVHVEDDRLVVDPSASVPNGHRRPGCMSRNGTTALSDARSGFPLTRAVTASARPMPTAFSK